jgi:hypothetical protein
MPGVGIDEFVVALDVEPPGLEHASDPMNEPHLVRTVDEHDLPVGCPEFGRHGSGRHRS